MEDFSGNNGTPPLEGASQAADDRERQRYELIDISSGEEQNLPAEAPEAPEPAIDQSGTSRRWCFTLNNYDERDETVIQTDVKFLYVVYGREVGASGTPHLQGYIHVKQPVRLSALRVEYPRAHWERAKGSETQNRAYCTKAGDFYERDDRHRGRRTDIESAVETLKQGGVKKVAAEHAETYVKFHRGFEALGKQLSRAAIRQDLEVMWLWGPTGTGKTHHAYAKDPGLCPILSFPQWFDPYEDEKAILIDDFRMTDGKELGKILRYLDKFPVTVPVKGSSRPLQATHIWITCPYRVETAFADYCAGEDLKQICRRIKWEIEFLAGGLGLTVVRKWNGDAYVVMP